ncbi:DUF6707 family protein [Sinomonas humi]|uniref:DUF6707 family protein n=1 Tax=Sinomonas humi TaxID=1338436 RepID=UPI00068DDA85|nr:DUF6707 family protein [Sinomonas humi]
MQYRPDSEPSGSNPHALENFRSIDASELRPGHRLVLPDGEGTAEIIEIDTVLDDYDNPALYFAILDNHLNLRVAHGTSARIVAPRPSRPADLLFSGPAATGPEKGGPEKARGEKGGPEKARGEKAGREKARAGSADEDKGPFDPAYAAIWGGEAADGDLRTQAEGRHFQSYPLENQGQPDNGRADDDGPAARDGGPDDGGPDDGGSAARDDGPATDESAGGAAEADGGEPERRETTITLDTGDVVVVPGKARVSTGGPSPAQLRLIPQLEGHPEDLIRHIDAVHPGRHAIHELCERLGKGINTKSGACLQDLRELAYELYVSQNDPENAQKVADLLAVVPFDGNPGRWASVESGLALAAHLARERGEDARAAVYSELLRAPETAEKDPFRAQMAARVRQRTLNEPNLYDKEVSRAAETGDEAEEHSWRILRLDTLLHLRAHGGSEAFDGAELDRRIRIELDAVKR